MATIRITSFGYGHAPAPAEHFLGFPPSPASQWIGRITHLHHQPGSTWTTGQLTLPSGVSIPWIAHTHTVTGHQTLFHPTARITVTGHELGGPLYLTAARPATDTEWADALQPLARQN